MKIVSDWTLSHWIYFCSSFFRPHCFAYVSGFFSRSLVYVFSVEYRPWCKYDECVYCGAVLITRPMTILRNNINLSILIRWTNHETHPHHSYLFEKNATGKVAPLQYRCAQYEFAVDFADSDTSIRLGRNHKKVFFSSSEFASLVAI